MKTTRDLGINDHVDEYLAVRLVFSINSFDDVLLELQECNACCLRKSVASAYALDVQSITNIRKSKRRFFCI